jgi:hypothetical protein
MGGRSGGGSSQPTEQIVKQTQFPEEAAPYYTRLLQRAEAESLQPYSQYGGQRLAYFSPDELNAQAMTRGFAGAGSPREYDIAAQKAAMAGGPLYSGYNAWLTDPGYQATDLQPGYGAGLIGGGYRGQQAYSTYRPRDILPDYQAGQIGSQYQAGQLYGGYRPDLRGSGYQGERAFSGYNPWLRSSEYQAGQMGPGYTPLGYEENLGRFMSPYRQAVTDVESQEAIRQSELVSDQLADRAAASGGLGGYREAIQQAELQRNLSTQLGDIQARGSQDAFTQAQQQLERERASGLGAAGFGLQRYGAQEAARQQQEQYAQQAFLTGEQSRQQAATLGLTAQQQTASSFQAQEKLQQGAYAAGESAKQEAARQGLTMAQQNEAARQAQEQFKQSAFQMTEQGRQQQEQLRQSAYQAGEAARQQAARLGLTAQEQTAASFQAQEQFRQSAFQMTEQGRQQQESLRLQAYQYGENAKQQAAKLGLTAAQQNEAARQAQEKFRQSSYDLTNRYALQSAGQMMDIGGARTADAQQRIQAMQQQGAQMRALQQAGLDIGYEDFLRQQAMPQQRLGQFSNLIQGLPLQPTQTVSTYQQQPGLFQQAVGMGLGGLGLYRGMGG